MAQEAEIACNPVTAFHALKPIEEKPSRDIKHPKANAFITNVKASDKSNTVMRTYSAVENSSKGFKRIQESKHFNFIFKPSHIHVLWRKPLYPQMPEVCQSVCGGQEMVHI